MDTYEKKYKEALERARQFSEKPYLEDSAGIVEYIFSELAESKDEKIRRNIKIALMSMEENLTDFYSTHHTSQKELLAWLEKQGEQEPTDNRLIPQKGKYYVCIKDYYSIDGKAINTKGKVYKSPCDGYINNNRGVGLSWINCHTEAYFSPIKDEDWIICENDNVIGESIQYKTLKSNKVLQKAIKKLEDNGFIIKLRRWTIQDAKDGDMLNSPSHRLIWIYKDKEHYHACVNMNYVTKNVATDGLISIPNDACPATKDEQTILFTKMQNSGYEWDSEKKELKKIEQGNSPLLSNSSNIGKDEQKPADKIEPKFKVGDWIVYEKNIYQIHNIGLKQFYECLRTDGTVHTFDFEYIDSKSHIWTIQDAKDGDVLVYGDNPEDNNVEIIMLFKSLRNIHWAFTHFHMYNDGDYRVNDWCDCGETAHPATKEQRDILFQKMHEARYEWDAEKKELK